MNERAHGLDHGPGAFAPADTGACSSVHDNTLVAAALLDRSAGVYIYDRHAEAIERYIRTRIDSSVDVEDLLHDTFERALTKLSTYQPARGTFIAWLFRIAHNRVVDYKRDLSKESNKRVTLVDTVPGPESLALRVETRGNVQKALQFLTDEQREALALRYANELAFKDIAEIMEKSEGSVKMLVQRGLNRLRHALQRGEYDV